MFHRSFCFEEVSRTTERRSPRLPDRRTLQRSLFTARVSTMKNSFRILTIALIAALALVAFAPVAQAQSATKVTLTTWSSSEAESKALQAVVDAFNAANSGKIEVTWNPVPDYDTTLAKDLASGNPPDAFFVDSFRVPDLVKAGQLAAIGDKMTDAKDFYPSLVNAFTVGGTFYCPPKDFGTLALQINTDMFAAKGLKAPTTWAELKEAAKALTTDTVAGISLPTDFARFIAFLYQAGGEVTDADYAKMAINSPEGLEALKFYTDLYLEGYAKTPADLNVGWPGEALGKGVAAMVVEGNWIVGYMKEQFPDIKYEAVELPAGPKGKATMAFTVCYGAPANGKNADASVALIDYLTGAEGMKMWTEGGIAMPARASLAEGWLKSFPERSAFIKGAEYARKWQFVPGFGAVLDEINKQLGLIFGGQQTPEDALKSIEEVGNEILAKAK
jgi:multiple sugar transport system substrate-binding protein